MARSRVKRTWKCDECPAVKESASEVSGSWKRICGKLHCEDCKNRLWMIRAVEFPVKFPLARIWKGKEILPAQGKRKEKSISVEVTESLPGGWGEFDRRIEQVLQNARHLANWGTSILFAGDVHTVHDGTPDLPSPPAIQLYRELFTGQDPLTQAHWLRWQGCTADAQCILRQVESDYRRHRWHVLRSGNRALHSYDSYPMRHHNNSWAVRAENGGFIVNFPLPPFPDDDIPALRLECLLDTCGRRPTDRQVQRLRLLAEGKCEQGEMAIYRRRASTGAHRHTQMVRGHSHRNPMRTFLKLVAWFPRPAKAETDAGKIITVFTDSEAFWVAVVGDDFAGERIWVENGDHIRRKIAGHAVYRGRIAQDIKHERRVLNRGQIRGYMEHARKLRCEKQDERVGKFIEQTAAAICGLAQRRRACLVRYVDKCRSYVETFPWAQFRNQLCSKLDEIGIGFEHVNGAEEDASDEVMNAE